MVSAVQGAAQEVMEGGVVQVVMEEEEAQEAMDLAVAVVVGLRRREQRGQTGCRSVLRPPLKGR